MSYAFNGILVDSGDVWVGFEGVLRILLTHAHFDHIYGLNKVLELNPDAKVYTNEEGREMLLDARRNLSLYHETPFVFEHPESIIIVNEGDEICLGDNIVAKAIFTPGHNPSCITWLVGECIFTGDSYIPGIKTITNLPKGNKVQAMESGRLILTLAEGKTIYPGHEI